MWLPESGVRKRIWGDFGQRIYNYGYIGGLLKQMFRIGRDKSREVIAWGQWRKGRMGELRVIGNDH